MMDLGSTCEEKRAMSVNDVYLSRLKLLIIMAKAHLKNYPIGKYRKYAIIKNARYVFYHSLQLITEKGFLENNKSKRQSEIIPEMETEEEYAFHKRVQLLAVMLKAVAENRPTGDFRKKALQNNLDKICDKLIFKFHMKEFDFFKVA